MVPTLKGPSNYSQWVKVRQEDGELSMYTLCRVFTEHTEKITWGNNKVLVKAHQSVAATTVMTLMAKSPILENDIHHLMSRFELGLVSVLPLGFL